jgi:hypothetical protein
VTTMYCRLFCPVKVAVVSEIHPCLVQLEFLCDCDELSNLVKQCWPASVLDLAAHHCHGHANPAPDTHHWPSIA